MLHSFKIGLNIVSFPHFDNCLPPIEIRSRNSKRPLHSGNIYVVVIFQREGSEFWLFAIVGWILYAPAKIRSHWEYQVVEISQFHQFGQMFGLTNKDLQMMLWVNLFLVSNCGQNNNSSNWTSWKKAHTNPYSKPCPKVNWRLNFPSCQVW